MPLPPRDMARLHLLLNPHLRELHARYPLARYVPVMALFRLYKLHVEGLDLLEELDEPSWMTLACLDDQGADATLCRAAMAMRDRHDAAAINRVVALTAAPYLVPLLTPGPAVMMHNPATGHTTTPPPVTPMASPATHISDSQCGALAQLPPPTAASGAVA